MPANLSRRCTLEVERKFRSLAAAFHDRGTPPFRSIKKHRWKILHDIYYDRSNLLASAGIWVRKRNARWEAKIKQGGSFANSKFQELTDPGDIAKCVSQTLGEDICSDDPDLGLESIADITTLRNTWTADDEFKIVLDRMLGFGHIVGEVELQQTKTFKATSEEDFEQQKQAAVDAMDGRVADFMERYSWAFSLGEPKGKLTAYFEAKQTQWERNHIPSPAATTKLAPYYREQASRRSAS
jgi:thiamine-triphosphatase